MSRPNIEYLRYAANHGHEIPSIDIIRLCDIVDRVTVAANDGTLTKLETDHINRALGIKD